MNPKSLQFVFLVFCYCGVKLVYSCTQDEFDEKAKVCLMKEFFETIKQKPKGDCSAAYLSMRNCINNVFYGCKKNNSELPNLTKIAQRAQAVIGSEKYYCRDGMLNSFKRINLQPDCKKKATKKVRKCTASFHKEFSEDKARASLCRKYTKAKKCVENVLKKFCKKTARKQHISQMYKDPFNPYCRGRVDTWKPPVKRLREPLSERRPVLIWFFDTSKQAVGAMLVHFANIFLAGLFQGDPCTWYLINFLLDSTLGLVVIYLCLQFMQVVVRIYDWDTLRFGEYGNPPQCKAWAGQCFLYLWAVIIEKATITLLVQLSFWEDVRKFILLPVKNYPKVELAISMLIIPFVFNAIMFWVVDNFLMRKKKKLLQKDDTRSKVKYERRSVMNGSDEEAVLLDNILEGESVMIPEENLYHRDAVRR